LCIGVESFALQLQKLFLLFAAVAKKHTHARARTHTHTHTRAALEDLEAEVEINSAWETIRENIKISDNESLGYFELKKHKPWFDEICSQLLYQRKQAKFQWLQDPSEVNGDNLKNV
jgi:hypothetical protein